MDLLWKKASRHESALYVDIFRKLDPELRCKFSDEKKKYFQMTESMINFHVRSEKSDIISIGFRKQGDKMFQQSKWYEAIKFYNRSLCFAKVGSMQMGIGYAKRAQCFFQLKMYEKCLMDLDLAKFSCYPKQQYALLHMRETECLKLIADGAKDVSAVPKLTLEPNDKYPDMVNTLKIERISDDSCYIAAAKDINVGEIVMIEKNFISTYTKTVLKCNVCCVSLTNLIPCNKCSDALLCPECHATNMHEIECDAQVLFSDNYGPISDTFRSILKVMNMFDDADELMAFIESIVTADFSEFPHTINDQLTKYRGFLHLAYGAIDLKEDVETVFINYSSLMGHPTVNEYFHKEKHRRFLMHLIFHHFSALKCTGVNSTAIGFDENTTVETDYSFVLGMNLDHSCAPHLTLRMVDGHAVMITVRPIKKGQRVTLAKNDTVIMKCAKERQVELEEEFGEKCKCERCTFESDASNKSTQDFEDGIPIVVRDPRMLLDPDLLFIKQHMNGDTPIEDEHAEKVVKCAENFLNKYGDQKWDDLLDVVFLCYYCGIKKKFEQCGEFLPKTE